MDRDSTPSYPFLTTYSSTIPPAPPNPGPGRPRVLNESKVRHILSVVARGCSLEQAARYVGCAASTIRREARRNPKFGDELRRVLVDSELFALATIREAAGRHWRAGRFLLEHSAAQRVREQNRRPLTRKQLRSFAAAIADVVNSEVKDLETRQRLAERFEQVVRDINRNQPVAPPRSKSRARSRRGVEEDSISSNDPASNIQNPAQTVNQCT
jgi:IS30 family transposase